jgi:hypothetical protein
VKRVALEAAIIESGSLFGILLFVNLHWFSVTSFSLRRKVSLMELSSYERDFENAKALRTLQDNTDPENLVPATKRKIEQAERHVTPESPNRPPLGALTIAQVCFTAANPQALCLF